MRENIHLKRCCPLKDANETFTLTKLGCRMFELCVKKPGHISLFKKSCQSLGGGLKRHFFSRQKQAGNTGLEPR